MNKWTTTAVTIVTGALLLSGCGEKPATTGATSTSAPVAVGSNDAGKATEAPRASASPSPSASPSAAPEKKDSATSTAAASASATPAASAKPTAAPEPAKADPQPAAAATAVPTSAPAAAPAAAPSAAPSAAPADNPKAVALFKDNCMACHGENLEGKQAPKLQQIGSKRTKDDIMNKISKGGKVMPAFGDILDKESIETLAAWLSEKK